MLKHQLSNKVLILALMLLEGLFGYATTAKADGCIDKAASCIVNSAKGYYYAASTVGEVLQFSVLHPQCVAAITSQDYISIGTMTTISGLAAAGAIGASESSCKNDLYGKYAGKIAGTLASIVPNSTLQDIASGEILTGIEGAMRAVPFPGTLPSVGMQLDCGCAVAAAGSGMLDKIKKTAQYTAAAVKTCTGAAACLGEAALDALTGVGEAVYATGECIAGPSDCGENPPMTEDSYYKEYWRASLNDFVEAQITNSKLTVSNGVGYVKAITPAQFITDTWHECEDYYLKHRYSGGALSKGDHAQRACNTMRDTFTAEANASRGVRMDSEVFPKVALSLSSPYLNDCAVPYKDSAKVTKNGVQLAESSNEAQTYGSDQLGASAECTKNMQLVIGKTPDGTLLAQEGSALWETKNTYKANGFDIKATYNKLMANGSKYDTQLKEIAKASKTQIATSGAVNEKTVMINKAYEKQGNEKWVEYKAKCPATTKLQYALDDTARSICLSQTADYLGVVINAMNDTNASDNNGYISFSSWKSIPKVYSAALASFEKSNTTQTLADARVTLAFATHEADLQAIAGNAYKAAAEQLKPIRQKQEQEYASKLQDFTQQYESSINCQLPATEAITHTCKYSQTALDDLFNAWHSPYVNFIQTKDALDKKMLSLVSSSLPFTGKTESDSEFIKLLSDIDKATKRSPQLYNNIKNKPDAVVKTSQTMAANKNAHSSSSALNSVKSKQAQSSATDGLGSSLNKNGPDALSDQAKNLGQNNLDLEPNAENKVRSNNVVPSVRGMRAAPGMVAVAPTSNKMPASQNRPPASVASLDETQQTMKDKIGAQGLKDQSPSLNAGLNPVAGAVQMPKTADLAASSNIRDAAESATQGGKLSPKVSAATNQAPSDSAPLIRNVPKPADNIGSGSVANLKEVASKPATNIGTSVAVGVATGAGNQRGADSLPAASNAPPPVKIIASNTPIIPTSPATKAPEPAFDRNLYQHVTRQKLESKWLPQCKNESCKTDISSLATSRINEVLQLLNTGIDLRVKATLDNAEAQMDKKYNLLMQAKVDASQPKIMEYEPPKTNDPIKPISNKPVIKKPNF